MRRDELFERIDTALAASNSRPTEDEALLAIASESQISLSSVHKRLLPGGPVLERGSIEGDVFGDSQEEPELDDTFLEGEDRHDFDWFAVVKTVPPLGAAEQVELAIQVEAGVLARGVLEGEVPCPPGAGPWDLRVLTERGNAAFKRMTVGNLGLVLYWARRTRSDNGYSIEDRFQDGVFGLMRAIEGWDYLRGYAFSTYATWHIRQQIARQQQDLATGIRVPVHVREKWAADRKSGKVSVEALEQARQLVYGVVPWEEVLDLEIVERGDEIYDPIDDLEYALTDRQISETFMNTLNSRQREVATSRFGLGTGDVETLDAIGRRLSVTRERIRQIEGAISKSAPLLYWSAVPWFRQVAWEQASRRCWMGGTIANLVLVEPMTSDRLLASECGVKVKYVGPVRELVEAMAKAASERVGAYGEPMSRGVWESILAELVFTVPMVDQDDDADARWDESANA